MSTNNSKHNRMSYHHGADRSRIAISVEPFYECNVDGREVGEGRRVLSASVPIVVRHYRESPGGESLAVGEVSPGSLDLALNILGHLYPPARDGEEPVRCRVNFVSATAYRLHHSFCAEFLAPMDPDGGELAVREIRDWVSRKGGEGRPTQG